jgi:hypothetical protein
VNERSSLAFVFPRRFCSSSFGRFSTKATLAISSVRRFISPNVALVVGNFYAHLKITIFKPLNKRRLAVAAAYLCELNFARSPASRSRRTRGPRVNTLL